MKKKAKEKKRRKNVKWYLKFFLDVLFWVIIELYSALICVTAIMKVTDFIIAFIITVLTIIVMTITFDDNKGRIVFFNLSGALKYLLQFISFLLCLLTIVNVSIITHSSAIAAISMVITGFSLGILIIFLISKNFRTESENFLKEIMKKEKSKY